MKIFLAIVAAFLVFATCGTKNSDERRVYSYCFMAVIAVIGALEIIPLFL